MTLLGDYIRNDNAFKGAAYVTLFVSLLSVGSNLLSLKQISDLLSSITIMHSIGFNWIVPVLIASVIGFFIKSKGSNAKSDSDEVTA